MHHDLLLPPSVARALEEYRALLAAYGLTWGEPDVGYVRMMSYLRFPEEARRIARPSDCGDLAAAFRDEVADTVPDGLSVLRLLPQEHRFEPGKVHAVLRGEPVPLTLLVDSRRVRPAEIGVDGARHTVGGGGAVLLDLSTDAIVTVDGERIDLSPARRYAVSAKLRLRSRMPCRWSVVSQGGQGWYPRDTPHRRDFHGRPFFHGQDVVLDVPAEPLTVRVARGMEYGTAEARIRPEPWRETVVELTPERIYDSAAKGWYGGDLHVHLNWAGDIVAVPAEAAAMQHGEDLHVLNLVAGNVTGERVYDREALEHWAGRDLPWSDATHVARMGVEYRNDLFGHVHAFGLATPPSRYHSGFTADADWPPNGMACGEMREQSAVLGYAHPFHGPVASPADVVGDGGRDCSARALAVDAALGLVDGVEVLHFSDPIGSAEVYRRLLGAGSRLAVLAGTDTMLSFTRQDSVSSPPGWERVYARLDGPLSAESFARAVRAGRTFATTGPWVELSARFDSGETAGIGDTLDLAPGDRITVRAAAVGPEVEHLEIRTAEGVVAIGVTEATAELTVTEPTFVVAVASGPAHPRSLNTQVYAHTSPIYLDVAGRHVARPDDVQWCLEWLDLLEDVVREHARLDGQSQLRDHLDLIAKARSVYRCRL
jgi:hypothetical protein